MKDVINRPQPNPHSGDTCLGPESVPLIEVLRIVDLLTDISLTCLLYYFSSYGRTVTLSSLKNNLKESK